MRSVNDRELREKVIEGLESIHAVAVGDGEFYVTDCGMKDFNQLLGDTLALLKAHEPRLVTESDFDGADEYGYIPVWTEEKDGDMYWECIPKVAITDPDGIEVLRYWTSRPDQATREATPWTT